MKKLALLSIASIALFGCQKEERKTLSQISTSDYWPRSVGSYWIYEHTQVDTNGVETATTMPLDSVYISGDTVINGETYSIIVGLTWYNPTQESYIRDSAGYVLGPYGPLADLTDFSTHDFYHDLSGLYDMTTYMEHPPGPITVPAGTFATVDRVQKAEILSPTYPWENPRYLHHYYAKGVGLIKEVYLYLSAPSYWHRKLVRYHIE